MKRFFCAAYFVVVVALLAACGAGERSEPSHDPDTLTVQGDVPIAYAKREAEEGTVAVRTLGAEHQKVMPLAEAIALIRNEATAPDLR